MESINKTIFALVSGLLLSSSCAFASTEIPAKGYTASVNYNEGANGSVTFYGNPNCTITVDIPGAFTRNSQQRIIGILGVTDRETIWSRFHATIG